MLARAPQVQGLTFACELLSSLLEDGLEGLLVDHWAEVAHDRELIALNPDWGQYLAEEKAGRFLSYSVHAGTTLVGYSGFFVLRSMHYRDHVFAVNDVIYLRPQERGVDGLALIVNVERDLAKRGVSKVFYHVKNDAVLGSPAGDSLEAIEERLEAEDLLGTEIDPRALESRTLGGVLGALGYTNIESHYGKLLLEKR